MKKILGTILVVSASIVFNFWEARAAVVEVTISADGTTFTPDPVTINAGDQIRWTSLSAFIEEPASLPHPTHTIYPALNVGPINPLGSVTSPSLTQVGTWGYHNHSCGSGCTATIIITAAASSVGSSQCADCVPPRITLLIVSSSSPTAIDISWATDEIANRAWIEYGRTTIYNIRQDLATSSGEAIHVAHLTGLTPATEYHYSIHVEDIAGNRSFPMDNFVITPALAPSDQTAPAVLATTTPAAPLPVSVLPSMPAPAQERSSTSTYGTMEFVKKINGNADGFRFQYSLQRGSRSEDVKILQLVFSSDPGIYTESLVTGYFGPLTESAVRKFQAAHKIIDHGDPVSTGWGRVGPKTRAKLNELITIRRP